MNTTQVAPVDPFTEFTPSFDATPEDGTKYNSGNWGVSEQNGVATYTYSIDVPPGRNGMAPSLALRYSSNLPLRGSLGVEEGTQYYHLDRSKSKTLSLMDLVLLTYRQLGSI